MASLKVFGQRIAKVSAKLEAKLNVKMQRLALAIEQALVLSTPVDTGRARANWQVTVGSPAVGEIEASGGNDVVGRVRDESGRFSTRFPSPGEILDRARAQLARRQPEQNIFISNNVPYIQRLNEGWSAQAPAGFIEAAVQEAVIASRGEKLL